MGSEASLLDGFAQGGMRVADVCDVPTSRAVCHGHDERRDEISRMGSNYMSSKYFVSVRVGKDLDESVSLPVASRPTVGHEGEGSFTVFSSGLHEIILSEPYPGNFWKSIND